MNRVRRSRALPAVARVVARVAAAVVVAVRVARRMAAVAAAVSRRVVAVASAAGTLRGVTESGELLHQGVAMVTLDLDHAVTHGAA